MTNHPHRSRRKVVTYFWTATGRAKLRQISLCRRHDTAENRIGFGQVLHGLHDGPCTLCEAETAEQNESGA